MADDQDNETNEASTASAKTGSSVNWSQMADTDIVGVVVVDGRRYAASLVWNVGVSSDVNKEAKEASERLGGNGYCVYTTPSRDSVYGLSESRLNHKPGQIALAGAFVNIAKPGGSYAGAFYIPKSACFWLVGVTEDGRVIFDKAYKNQDLAIKEFSEIVETVAWEKITCPPEWNIEGAQPSENLNAIFSGKKNVGPRLRSLRLVDTAQLTRVLQIPLLVLIAIMVVYYGIGWLRKPAAQPVAPRRPVAPKQVNRAWAGRVKGDALLQTCVKQILTYGGFFFAGWSDPGVITCDENTGVSLTLTKQQGTMNWVMPGVPKIEGFHPNVKVDFSTVRVNWSLPPMDKYENAGQGDDLSRVRLFFQENFDEIRQPITLTTSSDKLDYRMTTTNDIRIFYPFLLGRFGAHTVNRVTLSIPSMQWTVDGSVFADKPEYKQVTQPNMPRR